MYCQKPLTLQQLLLANEVISGCQSSKEALMAILNTAFPTCVCGCMRVYMSIYLSPRRGLAGAPQQLSCRKRGRCECTCSLFSQMGKPLSTGEAHMQRNAALYCMTDMYVWVFVRRVCVCACMCVSERE